MFKVIEVIQKISNKNTSKFITSTSFPIFVFILKTKYYICNFKFI